MPSNGPAAIKLLIVGERMETEEGMGLAELLEDYGRGSYHCLRWTVMDAYMRMFPAGVDLVVMDIGLFSPLHRELLQKLREEGGRPVIMHLTDDRADVVRDLDRRDGVCRLKKPASLHEVVSVIDRLLGRGAVSP